MDYQILGFCKQPLESTYVHMPCDIVRFQDGWDSDVLSVLDFLIRANFAFVPSFVRLTNRRERQRVVEQPLFLPKYHLITRQFFGWTDGRRTYIFEFEP